MVRNRFPFPHQACAFLQVNLKKYLITTINYYGLIIIIINKHVSCWILNFGSALIYVGLEQYPIYIRNIDKKIMNRKPKFFEK
jgi:hypothetical protein